MSAFVEDLAELVATLGPLDDQDDNFSDGANALADALKAAEGTLFRIDQDAPAAGDAYVIRIEHADGRRLKAVVPANRVPANGPILLDVLTALGRGIAVNILSAQGIPVVEPEVQPYTEHDMRQAIRGGQ